MSPERWQPLLVNFKGTKLSKLFIYINFNKTLKEYMTFSFKFAKSIYHKQFGTPQETIY